MVLCNVFEFDYFGKLRLEIFFFTFNSLRLQSRNEKLCCNTKVEQVLNSFNNSLQFYLFFIQYRKSVFFSFQYVWAIFMVDYFFLNMLQNAFSCGLLKWFLYNEVYVLLDSILLEVYIC